MLILTRRVGEALMVGDDTKIVVLGVKGSQIRLGINAPKDIVVHREEIFDKINIIKLKIETSIDNYRFRKAMSLVIDLSRLGNKYLADTEPWKIIKEDKDRVKSILYNSIQLVANIAILCEPLLPFTSLKILKILNMKYKSWIDVSDNLIKSGHHLGESSHIFSKIEDA